MSNGGSNRGALHTVRGCRKNPGERSDKRRAVVTATEIRAVELDSGGESGLTTFENNRGETRMKLPNALLSACLLASLPLATLAQTEPVIVQAEDPTAVLGTTMAVGTDATGATYVTTTLNETNQPNATTFPQKVGIYTITFPAPGNYELYARYFIGEGGANDDSWYYGQGFGNSTAWSLVNSGQIGFNGANQTVYTGGTVGSNAWRWVKVTGQAGQFPTVWTV